ncbi:MAG: hypothetical protein OHK0046_25650 [Anaerolineae bacterium]
MAKFAVYYVPPAQSLLYQRGSEILGYDVRRGQLLPEYNNTRARLPEFREEWVTQPQSYGFHVTTGYSLYFDTARLPQIEREMEDVCNCFSPGLEFTFTPAAEHITFWNDSIVVLRYDPNPAMLMLHTMLTARVNPYGNASNISESYAQKNPADLDPVKAHRVRKYYTPYMLDGWTPHFTLMMPYTGQQTAAMRTALHNLFPPEPIRVESISLLVKGDHDTHYQYYREFRFADFPQPLL